MFSRDPRAPHPESEPIGRFCLRSFRLLRREFRRQALSASRWPVLSVPPAGVSCGSYHRPILFVPHMCIPQAASVGSSVAMPAHLVGISDGVWCWQFHGCPVGKGIWAEPCPAGSDMRFQVSEWWKWTRMADVDLHHFAVLTDFKILTNQKKCDIIFW